ncbi:hypothetical protein [Pseudofrankia sp. DC12]|uniref:hypothetical protein n=1 Tax=Pseudofrankia sp. DC12 TaxID=683315 RepID=UPI0006967F54|nr:hypothetical protein [Pseudofrankia sp. DC12]
MSTSINPAAAAEPVDPRQLRRVARALDGALWLVALMVCAYSLANVHGVATSHGTADPQAWLLAPIVDIALFGGITADSILSRYAVRPSGWGATLRWVCGCSTWTLNVWDAAGSRDMGAIVAHSIPPLVLILLAEAAPRYRQQFAALVRSAPAPADTAPVVEPAAAPEPVAVTVPAPRTGTPARRRTGTATRPATGTRTARRTDAELLTALTDVPRDDDGTVPVRRAAAALNCGPDRARRLLDTAGLRRPTPIPALTVAAA